VSWIRDTLGAVADMLWPIIPPALGAFFGLRYATEQTRRERAISWFSSMMAGIYIGPAIGEHLQLGPKTTVGVSFILAMVGAEFFAVAVAAMRQWAQDPVGAFAKWRDAILGRKS
jgi:uncharacterized membrane protein YeaQ/YmgE (transglycosylase-associated protein family)